MLGRRLDGIVAFWSPCTPEEVAGAEEAAAEGAMLEALGWLGAFSLVMPEMPVEGGALFWWDIDLTVNIHHCKLNFVTSSFNISVRFSIKFNVHRPSPLNKSLIFEDQGAQLEGGVVFLKQVNDLRLS